MGSGTSFLKAESCCLGVLSPRLCQALRPTLDTCPWGEEHQRQLVLPPPPQGTGDLGQRTAEGGESAWALVTTTPPLRPWVKTSHMATATPMTSGAW